MQIIHFRKDGETEPESGPNRPSRTGFIVDCRRNLAMRLVCWAFLIAGTSWTPTALDHFVAFVGAAIEDERRRP